MEDRPVTPTTTPAAFLYKTGVTYSNSLGEASYSSDQFKKKYPIRETRGVAAWVYKLYKTHK